jgi:hypothetical protein
MFPIVGKVSAPCTGPGTIQILENGVTVGVGVLVGIGDIVIDLEAVGLGDFVSVRVTIALALIRGVGALMKP